MRRTADVRGDIGGAEVCGCAVWLYARAQQQLMPVA